VGEVVGEVEEANRRGREEQMSFLLTLNLINFNLIARTLQTTMIDEDIIKNRIRRENGKEKQKKRRRGRITYPKRRELSILFHY
jgi:hypothetical protein